MMNFKEYAVEAKKTAIYPKEYANLYLLSGLTSELGEVSGVIKKYIRDSIEEPFPLLKLKAELGDCFWYLAMICTDLYPDFPTQKFGLSSQVNSYVFSLSVHDLEMALSYILKTNNLIHNLLSSKAVLEHSSANYKALNDIYLNLKSLATMFNLSPREVMNYNIEKLKSRMERNQLKGNGDER